LDLLLGYDFGERYYGFLDRANVSLHVRNLFDTDPPFVDNINGIGYDAINANPMGRFLALQLTKAW
jgi:outer membrane receptor protein involved in Fe transport